MALILDENGGSVELCVVKRSGSVPATGLTVQLRFQKSGDTPLADMESDYTISGGSVSFPAAAADGEQSCINVTAMCDDSEEENEAVAVSIPSSTDMMYVRNGSGNGFVVTETIKFMDGSGCPLSPPENLIILSDAPPTITIGWDAPASGGTSLTYKVTIQQVIGYCRQENDTTHTIIADGIEVLFNTIYDVIVTAVNALGRESVSVPISLMVMASAPPTPTISATIQCFQIEVTWMYGITSSSVYSPSIESVSVAYSAESNEDGGLACSDLTESETSCEIMITKPDSYTLTVQLINAVGTTTASTSVSAESLDTPMPPQELQDHFSTNVSSFIVIKWGCSLTKTENISTYRIRIRGTTYSEEVTCQELECAHTITADGSDVLFNTMYDVEITAVSTCGVESMPLIITVNIMDGPTSTNDSGVPAVVFAGVGGMMVVLIALILIVILLVIFLVRRNRHKKNRSAEFEGSLSENLPMKANPVYGIHAHNPHSEDTGTRNSRLRAEDVQMQSNPVYGIHSTIEEHVYDEIQ